MLIFCFLLLLLSLGFFLFCFVLFCFLPFKAAPTAHGGSQARGQIGAVATGLTPEPWQRGIRDASATYTTAHGNTGSLSHWARPWIEPATSWFLVGLVSTAPGQELPKIFVYNNNFLLIRFSFTKLEHILDCKEILKLQKFEIMHSMFLTQIALS